MPDVADSTGERPSLVEYPFEYLSRIPRQYWEVLFFFVLLVYTVLLANEARGYSEDARIFPLVVSVPLIGMLIAQIVLLLAGDRLSLSSGGMFDNVSQGLLNEEDEEQINTVTKQRREFSAMLWIIALVSGIFFLGFIRTIPVFVFAYVAYQERDLRKASLVTVILTAFLYVLFLEILNTPLWTGILEVPL